MPRSTTVALSPILRKPAKDLVAGETVPFEVAEPLTIKGVLIVDKTTKVDGKVMYAKKSGSLGRPGIVVIYVGELPVTGGAVLHLHSIATWSGAPGNLVDADSVGDGNGAVEMIGQFATGIYDLLFVRGKNVRVLSKANFYVSQTTKVSVPTR